jgi:hypothetical protein
MHESRNRVKRFVWFSALFGYCGYCGYCFFGCFFRSPGDISKQKLRNRKLLLDFVTRLMQESVT